MIIPPVQKIQKFFAYRLRHTDAKSSFAINLQDKQENNKKDKKRKQIPTLLVIFVVESANACVSRESTKKDLRVMSFF
jgi:hypothetical protein